LEKLQLELGPVSVVTTENPSELLRGPQGTRSSPARGWLQSAGPNAATSWACGVRGWKNGAVRKRLSSLCWKIARAEQSWRWASPRHCQNWA